MKFRDINPRWREFKNCSVDEDVVATTLQSVVNHVVDWMMKWDYFDDHRGHLLLAVTCPDPDCTDLLWYLDDFRAGGSIYRWALTEPLPRRVFKELVEYHKAAKHQTSLPDLETWIVQRSRQWTWGSLTKEHNRYERKLRKPLDLDKLLRFD